MLFLSTLSLRRATERGWSLEWVSMNFYPRSPCGERPLIAGTFKATVLFLSTLSLRRATILNLLVCILIMISIHALLAESDRMVLRYTSFM